jgi:hypothetical protein
MMFSSRKLVVVGFSLLLPLAGVCFEEMHWPTPYPVEDLIELDLDWTQPTVSGIDTSATFGCVRNDGHRFHEGIDIQPYWKRSNGEATDDVMAAWSGKVAYINDSVKDSGYGRYVVIEHGQFAPAVCTLYAHLAEIEDELAVGQEVLAGDRLGTMGRSAGGYRIPKSRAHLHFEIALRLSDDFQLWYDAREYESKNEHGNWSGLNLIGLDPWAAWHWLRQNEPRDIGNFIQRMPPGFIFEIATSGVPDIVRRNPSLLSQPVPASGVVGWRVSLTGWGFPLQFTPLTEMDSEQAGVARITAVNSRELEQWPCRGLVEKRRGMTQLSARGTALVELIFMGDLR